MIDIRPDHLETVKRILAAHVPECEVRAFGSRVNWTAKDYSDLDLAVVGKERLDPQCLSQLTEALENSDLPIRVDVLDWHAISEKFRKVIEKQFEVVQKAEKESRDVAGEWRETTLDDIAEFRNGKAISPERYSSFGRHPVFGSNGQIARTDDVLNTEPIIVIGRVGAYCGSVYYISEASWVTDNAIVALPKFGNDLHFLFYLFSSLGLRRTAIGSAQPLMTQGGLKVVQTKVPLLAQQQAIASVLGALDDKIESNRHTSQSLERVARAIFRAWFVDFEPVKAKAAGARSFPGMPQEIFDALPTNFVESELGPVPEGWGVGEMGDIGHQRREQVAPDDTAEGTAYIGLEHMPRRCIALTDWGTADTVTSAKSRFTTGDILFGKLRPYFHKVGPAPVDGVCSTDIVVLSAKRTDGAAWLLMLVSSDEFVSHANQTSAGTKMPRTNWKDMASFPVALPPADLLGAFQQIAEPMLDLIRQSIWESRKVAAQRDYLLPKLLSGEVRVKATDSASSILEPAAASCKRSPGHE